MNDKKYFTGNPSNGRKLLRLAALGILALALTLPLEAMDVSMKALELSTVGASTETSFVLESSAYANIVFSGGPKFGGNIELGFSGSKLEEYIRDKSDFPLSVGLLSFTAYRIGNLPLDISLFLGNGDSFCNGDSFASWFDDAPAGTDYRGIQYFPTGINGDSAIQYDGIHKISGTGLNFALRHNKNMISALYFYQDMDFARAANIGDDLDGGPGDLVMNSGFWSTDIRFLLNYSSFKLEAFAGLSFPSSRAGTWRGGILAFISTGDRADFLLQAGVPRWDSDRAIDIDNFYFLFEPRIRLGPTSINITLFYHPYWYRQEETGYQAATDLNIRFTMGKIERSLMEGGLEASLYFRGHHSGEGPLGISINPFYSFLYSGVRWDIKAMIDPFSFSQLEHLARLYLGVRTAF